jgi:hypothetical protein
VSSLTILRSTRFSIATRVLPVVGVGVRIVGPRRSASQRPGAGESRCGRPKLAVTIKLEFYCFSWASINANCTTTPAETAAMILRAALRRAPRTSRMKLAYRNIAPLSRLPGRPSPGHGSALQTARSFASSRSADEVMEDLQEL